MKIFALILSAVAMICAANQTASAQADGGLVSKFLTAAKASKDGQLGGIAAELTGKAQDLGANAAIKGKLDPMFQSLTGGWDSDALKSAYDLVKGAGLTPEQMWVARHVGNLASAYLVQKNFATLEGSQSDVATIMSSLRGSKIAPAIPALKNVASNAHMPGGQKQLIGTVADKYAHGWRKAKDAMDAVNKLPGF